MKNRSVIPIVLALLILSAMTLQAQFTSATLTGVVSDPSGAVVPQAKSNWLTKSLTIPATV